MQLYCKDRKMQYDIFKALVDNKKQWELHPKFGSKIVPKARWADTSEFKTWLPIQRGEPLEKFICIALLPGARPVKKPIQIFLQNKKV